MTFFSIFWISITFTFKMKFLFNIKIDRTNIRKYKRLPCQVFIISNCLKTKSFLSFWKVSLFLIDNSNNVTVDQKGTGNHYADITLTDSHTVDVTQDGSGDHNATINLSGNSTTIDLTQDSSTSQNYYIQQNCVTSGGCGTTTITQN